MNKRGEYYMDFLLVDSDISPLEIIPFLHIEKHEKYESQKKE